MVQGTQRLALINCKPRPGRRDQRYRPEGAQFYLWMWLSSIQNLVQFYLHQTCSLTLKVYDI